MSTDLSENADHERVVLLAHLRQCIKSVLVSQMEKNQLRKSLLCSRKRAEVMHVITQLGDKVAITVANNIDAQVEWSQLRDAFLLMLEN